ncbi:MAG: hypothetical protein J3R72DRAFT_435353 [Linnemannia gamsii]|nr:MAG: hypothetical protein J3R72DRAFT_435353 [Linnemannia gamsii]
MRFSIYKTKHRSLEDSSSSHPSSSTTIITHTSSTTATTTAHKPISPLDIPELLDRIFSYIDNKTLGLTVILVCSRWLLLNQHRLVRELYWDESWDTKTKTSSFSSSKLKTTLARLPGVTRVYFRCFGYYTTRGDAVDMLLKALQLQDVKYREQLQEEDDQQNEQQIIVKAKKKRRRWFCILTTPTNTTISATTTMVTRKKRRRTSMLHQQPLRELEIRCMYPWATDHLLKYQLPSTLTSLRLEFGHWFQIQLHKVLEDCPVLEVLDLQGWDINFGDESWVPVRLRHQAGKSSTSSPGPLLPLRSLILTNPAILQSRLEELLTVTPRLLDLKLRDVLCTRGQPGSDNNNKSSSKNNNKSSSKNNNKGSSKNNNKSSNSNNNNINNDDDDDGREVLQFSWDRFYKHLRGLPIRLESLHLTVRNLPPEEIDVRQRMIHCCPKLTEWTLTSEDITPPLLQELEAIPNVVTRLELILPIATLVGQVHRDCPFGEPGGDSPVPATSATATGAGAAAVRLLHQYLCQSPHLQHLKTTNIIIDMHDLDIWGRIGYGTLSEETSSNFLPAALSEARCRRKPIWRCQGLKTLQIEVHAHVVGKWDVNSRIIFGYIAAVCPRLETLELRTGCHRGPGAHGVRIWSYGRLHSLELSGGLCLLSRLRHLKRLTVAGVYVGMAYDCFEFEVNWIAESGRQCVKAKQQRRTELACWSGMLEIERQLEERRLQSTSYIPSAAAVIAADDAQQLLQETDQGVDRVLLEEIGLLSGVKRMAEAIDADDDGYDCFPALERVSLEGIRDYGYSREQLIHVMFDR